MPMDRAKAVATQCCSSRESVRPCFSKAALNEMRNLREEASGLVPEEVHRFNINIFYFKSHYHKNNEFIT